MNHGALKKISAQAALKYVEEDSIVGVGTGSTVNYFIDALATIKSKIEGAVASSNATAQLLKERGIPVYDLNSVNHVPLYVDGADEIDNYLYMIKGGGGAQTREKILASAANKFICIADISKKVDVLGLHMPVPVEVIPMARSYVAREIVKLGADPIYREHFTTDNGNIVLDIHHLKIMEPLKLEQTLKNITGVVESGIFAKNAADILLLGTEDGVQVIQS